MDVFVWNWKKRGFFRVLEFSSLVLVGVGIGGVVVLCNLGVFGLVYFFFYLEYKIGNKLYIFENRLGELCCKRN